MVVSEFRLADGEFTNRSFAAASIDLLAPLLDEGCAFAVGLFTPDLHRVDTATWDVVEPDAEAVARYADAPQGLDALSKRWNRASMQWEDERTLEQLRAAKLEEIKRSRRAAIEAGFDHGGHVFQADPVSLQNITGATLAALIAQQAQQPFAVDWTAADNTVVSLDAAAAIALGMAAVAHVSAAYAHGVELREAIAAAESPGELEGITW